MVKSAIFVVEKPLEMGPVDLQKFWKTKQKQNKKQQQQQQQKRRISRFFFLREKKV